MPISGIYEIKGVGYVFGGRLEKGAVKPGEKVVFLRAHHAQAVHPECLLMHRQCVDRQARMATRA